MNILFVCTGNICRSPSAEALLRHKLEQRGLASYTIDSAGVAGYHIGEPPDHRAIQCAHQYGVDMSPLRARKVCADDFSSFDLIYAMDNGHLEILRNICPAPQRHKIKLFNQHIYGAPSDVEDPYYGDQRNFNNMFTKLDESLDIFIKNHT
jgi:protein-tyrosine phosphatase